ncbi:DUF86 domain-containing protein, partial [Pseudomonas aeruginosa]|uniref:HepT-like ribonuclease domain-containing protein n=1 Tax=Pseudomonas aeruginosa TaxID=287 RepID=UPI0022CE33DB
QNDVTLKMPAFEWVHVQLHQQKGMISLSPPTICNSARNRMAHGYFDINLDVVWETVQEWLPALLQQLPAVRQDADDEDRNDKGMEP